LAASRYLRNRLFIDANQRLGFIILSDSPDLACEMANKALTQNFKENNIVQCMEGSYGSPQPLFDWILLTLCDHIIASSGTFAVWAGHHSHGKIVNLSFCFSVLLFIFCVFVFLCLFTEHI
jgi:hypothetical protein